ncbi:hypothetical protein BH11BAC2_BH11BAC2_05060 [soil metagenome]
MKFNKWKFIVKEYFTYTRRERNGIFILASALVILQGSLLALHFLPDPHPLELDSATLANVQLFINDHPTKKIKNETPRYFKKDSSFSDVKIKPHSELFFFDPNHLPVEKWMLLGLSTKQAAAIHRWEEHGGSFRKNADVQRMTVISDANFQRMEPWIRIENNTPIGDTTKRSYQSYKQPDFAKKIAVPVELNAADSNLLMELPMIGEGRARAIIRYRNYLGGFINVEQLREIKFLPDSVLKVILPMVRVDKSLVRTLNINTVKQDSLRHPYISWALGKMIINYRNEHGIYKSIDDMRSLPLVNDEILSKLAPYLNFNP